MTLREPNWITGTPSWALAPRRKSAVQPAKCITFSARMDCPACHMLQDACLTTYSACMILLSVSWTRQHLLQVSLAPLGLHAVYVNIHTCQAAQAVLSYAG